MRSTVALFLGIALFAASAAARQGFYWTTAEGTFIAVDYLSYTTADFDTIDGDTGGERSLVSGQYEFAGDTPWVLGGGHEYNALDIDAPPEALPQTNGDLHTLHIAAQWGTGFGPGNFRLAFAPALSVSSNGLKNPDELDSDAVQLWGAAVYTFPAEPVEWILGAVHDYRFGESRVYPVAGLQWHFDKLFLRITYPDLLFALDLTRGWSVEFSTSPDGNEWLAYDRDLEQRDEFRLEAWQSNLKLAYQFGNGIRLGVSAGYQWNQDWTFRRVDGDTARTESDDRAFFGLHLGWNPGRPREP